MMAAFLRKRIKSFLITKGMRTVLRVQSLLNSHRIHYVYKQKKNTISIEIVCCVGDDEASKTAVLPAKKRRMAGV